MELVDRMLSGSRQALAQLISQVESDLPQAAEIMKDIHPHIHSTYTIGITGPPGAGKSTVVDKLTAQLRQDGKRVGIIAVDPTSPFSQGAFLGDRIRMQQHYLDDGVYIRSMATRGSLGGLPTSTWRVIKIMDAFGFDIILVETVGVGQVEVDIAEAADTTIVILVPEAGDTIQTMKAGLLEIADILVVNKADREGADHLATQLQGMLRMNEDKASWKTPVLLTQAAHNIGIDQLYRRFQEHHRFLHDSGRFAQRHSEQRRAEFIGTIELGVKAQIKEMLEKQGDLKNYMEAVEKGELDPYSAAMQVHLAIRNKLTK
ncbi:MAG: methylmalonyl Co-A mutase-associated GTPase MeaB [Chloroflexota bacterium]